MEESSPAVNPLRLASRSMLTASVPIWKLIPPRRGPGGELRHDSAGAGDGARQLGVLARVDLVGTCAEHGDRAARRHSTAVRRRVDTQRQPAGDDQTGACQVGGKVPRDLAAGRRGIAAAHDGQLGQAENIGVARDEQAERRFTRLY